MSRIHRSRTPTQARMALTPAALRLAVAAPLLALVTSGGLACSDDTPPPGGIGIGLSPRGGATLPVNDPRPPCNGPTDAHAYGAVGDGVQDDTIAIQSLIDACAKGGGIAVIPAGTYQVGPLFLRQNLTLELDSGGLLQGTSDMADYLAAANQNGGAVPSLINATNISNIKITGSGTIDGAGAPWWAAQNAASAAGQPDPFRPLLMDIKNVNGFTMENVTLRNSPKFHVLLETSQNITITGVTITAPSNSPNTDGIDPKTCKHVRITGCNISVGDDNVAVTTAGSP